jgi:Leucine-rich repeat (LRR) protein
MRSIWMLQQFPPIHWSFLEKVIHFLETFSILFKKKLIFFYFKTKIERWVSKCYGKTYSEYDRDGKYDGPTITINYESQFDANTACLDPLLYKNRNDTTTITINNTKIAEIPPGLLNGLTDLSYLNLIANSISQIATDAFDGLSSLSTLILDQNKITSMPTFRVPLSNLNYLNINYNSLKTISKNDFNGLPNLYQLQMYGNQLTTVPNTKWLSTLSYIHMSSNRISAINREMFTGMTNMRLLNLDWNSFSRIPREAFAEMINMEGLYVSGGSLKVIYDDLFVGLTSLNDVWLCCHQLSTLPNNLINNAGNIPLWRFAVHSNKISEIQANLFDSVKTTMKDVYFNDNQLTTLPLGLFSGNHQKYIYISSQIQIKFKLF